MPKPDAFRAACPSREILARLGDKWASLIIAKLGEGPLRFTELSRRVEGISNKMLTQTLRHLERDGLVERVPAGSRTPATIDYDLTSSGKSVLPLILQAKAWAEQHFESVLRARASYDERHARA